MVYVKYKTKNNAINGYKLFIYKTATTKLKLPHILSSEGSPVQIFLIDGHSVCSIN